MISENTGGSLNQNSPVNVQSCDAMNVSLNRAMNAIRDTRKTMADLRNVRDSVITTVSNAHNTSDVMPVNDITKTLAPFLQEITTLGTAVANVYTQMLAHATDEHTVVREFVATQRDNQTLRNLITTLVDFLNPDQRDEIIDHEALWHAHLLWSLNQSENNIEGRKETIAS